MTNREIEQHYFEQFRKAYVLPAGVVEYGDKPDILLNGPHTTGIEITRLYLQPGSEQNSEQRQRPLRERVLSDAQKLHSSRGGKSIELTVGFDSNHPINKPRMTTLPAQIADLASHIEANESGEVKRGLFQATMPELASVYLNANEYVDAEWRVSPVHSVDFMSTETLANIVKDKENKSAEYKSCDAYWLLIVVDWIDPAQEQEIRIEGLTLPSAVFDKIIVYKPIFDHIVEVAVRD